MIFTDKLFYLLLIHLVDCNNNYWDAEFGAVNHLK